MGRAGVQEHPLRLPAEEPRDSHPRRHTPGAGGGQGPAEWHQVPGHSGPRDMRPHGSCPLTSRTGASHGAGARAQGRWGAGRGLAARTPPEGRPPEMPAPDSRPTALWPENRKRHGHKQARMQAAPRAGPGVPGPPLGRRGGLPGTEEDPGPGTSPGPALLPSGPWVASRGIWEKGLSGGGVRGTRRPASRGWGHCPRCGQAPEDTRPAGQERPPPTSHAGSGYVFFRKVSNVLHSFLFLRPSSHPPPPPPVLSTLDRYDNCGRR